MMKKVQVNDYEVDLNFFHISHNLTWYSAIVHKFTRIYPVYSRTATEKHLLGLFNLWTEKTIHVNLCKKLRNWSQKEQPVIEIADCRSYIQWLWLELFYMISLQLLSEEVSCCCCLTSFWIFLLAGLDKITLQEG